MRKLTALRGHRGSILAVAIFEVDEKSIIISAGETDEIILWNTDGEVMKKIMVSVPSICALGALDDGQGSHSIVAGSSFGVLQIYDFKLGELTVSLRHRGLRAIAISENKKLVVSGGLDGTITIRDHHTGFVVSAGGLTDVYALAIATGDEPKVISGGSEKMINIWNATNGEHLSFIETTGPIYAITVLNNISDPLIIAAGRDRIIRSWSINTLDLKCSMTGHEGVVLALTTFSFVTTPETLTILISASADRTIRLWNAMNGLSLCILSGHVGAVTSLAVSKQSSKPWIVSGSFDGVVLLWDVEQYLYGSDRAHEME